MTHLESPSSSNGLGLSSGGDHLHAMDARHDAASERKASAADDKGRVAYGPGFYVPPPGYPASTFVLDNAMPKRELHETVAIEMPAAASLHAGETATDTPSFQPDGRSEAVGLATAPLRLKGGARSRPQIHGSRLENRCYTGTRARTSSPSTSKALIIWPLLALLLAASQSMLLSIYERKQNAASIALGSASFFLHLFAALLSIFGLLIATNLNPVDGAGLELKGKRRRKGSCMVSIAHSLPTACGMLVCLGAPLQLISLASSPCKRESNRRYGASWPSSCYRFSSR